MEIVPARPGGPALDPVLEDYRRRYTLSEETVLSALLQAWTMGRVRTLVATEAGRVLGAVIVSLHRGDQGEIHLLHALPGAPLGTLEALLKGAEAEIDREGGRKRLNATLALLPGLPLAEAFRNRGYDIHPRVRMVIDVADLPRVDPPPGYRTVPWDGKRLHPAAALLAAARAGLEDANLYPEYAGREGAQRLVERVVGSVFGSFNSELSPMALHGEALVALCLAVWHGVFSDQGFIVDLAVDRAHRRQGLGRALVAQVGQAFRQAGAAVLALAVTRSNHPALRLYEQLGFREEQSFAVFVRPGETEPRPGL